MWEGESPALIQCAREPGDRPSYVICEHRGGRLVRCCRFLPVREAHTPSRPPHPSAALPPPTLRARFAWVFEACLACAQHGEEWDEGDFAVRHRLWAHRRIDRLCPGAKQFIAG